MDDVKLTDLIPLYGNGSMLTDTVKVGTSLTSGNGRRYEREWKHGFFCKQTAKSREIRGKDEEFSAKGENKLVTSVRPILDATDFP